MQDGGFAVMSSCVSVVEGHSFPEPDMLWYAGKAFAS